ncbi:MAG: glutamate racemase [Bacteroidetes bacterium]|nr:glutamate racemase [Rhodothermia bacterium]MCS7155784.1 glutamate racemase [Bacteroidota bacterium]MCX7906115.1 glutamate racemase [Bacteroidota bacterium]MDW8138243.1 glutamate racemase [Bacteroidota bacterium]MDW8285927.1 glutamate racemase [Bacteroidota bacterium]
MHLHPESPIGVFDSGIGGLTVMRALMDRLPFEHLLYFGDTARVPYGVKSVETIAHYATQIASFLLERGVKLLVVACNTIAAVAYSVLDELSPVPVLDVIEAGARMAVAVTRTKRVAVIGTPATVNSNAYARAIHSLDPEVRLFSQACPLFVPLVEEGWLDHPVTRMVAQEYLRPVLAARVDTLVLGCTHYPLLKPLLQEVMGPEVQLVDSAEAMAERVAGLLQEMRLLNPSRHPPRYEFYVTDVPLRFRTLGERFLGRVLPNVHLVRW